MSILPVPCLLCVPRVPPAPSPRHAAGVETRALTSLRLCLQRGQLGRWSRQRSRHSLQKVCPHGVVTGSKNILQKSHHPWTKGTDVGKEHVCYRHSSRPSPALCCGYCVFESPYCDSNRTPA